MNPGPVVTGTTVRTSVYMRIIEIIKWVPGKMLNLCFKLKYISAPFCNFGHFVFCSPGICTLDLWPGELCTVLRCLPLLLPWWVSTRAPNEPSRNLKP